MSDLSHFFSGDVSASATGDLLAASALDRSNQRVLRRLLTNPGDYIWNPEYGAGLPARIGTTLNVAEMTGLIRSQVALEASVAQDPEPEVQLAPIPNGVRVGIRYTLAETNAPASLSFSVAP